MYVHSRWGGVCVAEFELAGNTRGCSCGRRRLCTGKPRVLSLSCFFLVSGDCRGSVSRLDTNNWYHELVHLGCRPLAGGMPPAAAFAGGCEVKLRAACRPMEVRGVAAAIADAEAARGESTASAASAEALHGGAEAADVHHGAASTTSGNRGKRRGR
ncbi:hypothetical protein VPH35_081436 [Triticum aestivum]